MWPLYIASLFGRYFSINFLANPENDTDNPESTTLINVDFTGNPRGIWWNCVIHFFIVCTRMMILHVCSTELGGVSFCNYSIYIPSMGVYGLLCPTMMIRLSVYWSLTVCVGILPCICGHRADLLIASLLFLSVGEDIVCTPLTVVLGYWCISCGWMSCGHCLVVRCWWE